MLRCTLLVGALALAGSAAAQTACSSQGGFQVPNGGTPGCVCPSTQYWLGSSCQPNPVNGGCSNPATSDDNSFSTTGMNLTTAEMDGSTTQVTLNLAMPMLQNRNYTNFYILAPGSTNFGTSSVTGTACDAQQFTGIVTPAGTSACKDTWILTTNFNRLRGCGFTKQTTVTTGFESYDGVIRVTFQEPVTLGTGNFAQSLTRSASIDFPFRVNFDSQFTFELNATNLKVVSDYQVDFGITNQNIKTTGNPTIDVQYTVQYPYAIVAWAPPTSDNSAMTPSINAIDICAVGSYTYGTASASTCRKTNTITFTTARNSAAACQFTNDVVTLPFVVGCAKNLPSADCPFTNGFESTNIRTNNANQVQFTLDSENFCNGTLAQSSNINNAITLKEFKSVSNFGTYPSGGTQQNSWRYGDYAFYQILLDGLPVQSFTISTLNKKFGSDSDYTGTNLASSVVKQDGVKGWGSQQTVGSIALTDLGLKGGDTYGGQDYRFALLLDNTVLGSVVGGTNRGQSYPLRLKAVCDVSYQTSTTPDQRRRRRQATTDSGSGTVESSEATITAPEEEVAAQPSSAARTGPVLALVVVLLSAVLMA